MSKYGNIPTTIDGITFPSKLEARRYVDLSLLQKAGEITGLERQVTYRFEIGGVHVCNYICDFQYLDKNGALVVEDTKSPATVTPEYRIKEKLMKALHGITVVRVYKPESRLSKKSTGKRKIPSRRRSA